jgi:DNA-binding response OmpR family regulator
MRSEFVTIDGGLLTFNPQPLSRLSWPCGTARASGQRLSAMETALLTYFQKHAGRTLSRDELAEQVWKQRHFHESRTIDQTVSKLRKKLRRNAKILSIWSAGYRFESESAVRQQTKAFRRR